MKRLSGVFSYCLLGVLLLSGTVVRAASAEYYLNFGFASNDVEFVNTQDYIKIRIEEVGSDLRFTVNTLPALDQYANLDGNYGLHSFGFNSSIEFDAGTKIKGKTVGGDFIMPEGWGFTADKRLGSGIGVFAQTFQSSAGANANPLVIEIRNIGLDTFLASLSYSTGNTTGDYLFAAHVNPLQVTGQGFSAWFAGSRRSPMPVPEPSTWLLMLAGLASLVLIRKNNTK